MRTMMGLSTLCLAGPGSSLPGPLAKGPARGTVVAAAVSELVLDKLPNVPDRTNAVGLSARMALGASAAGVAAHQMDGNVALAAVIGATAALATAYVARAARVAAARRVPAIAAAVAEDVLAATIGFAGARAALT
jgi:uncharacterized membrane protein